MICSACTCQPLLPVTPVITQWAHEQIVQGGRNEHYEWTQQHGFLLSKEDLTRATAEHSISQQQKSTLSLWYGTIPWVYQPATWWQVYFIEPLPSWKGQHFVLTGIDNLEKT